MKRFSRSNTIRNAFDGKGIFSFLKNKNEKHDTEIEIENNNNINNINKKVDLNDDSKDKQKEDISPKKLHSGDSIVNINYISEEKIQKKRKEQEYEIEIQKMSKILLTSEAKEDEIKDENSLIYLLINGPKKFKEDNKNKDKLIEIIKYLLEKPQKNEKDFLIIKTYFLKLEKLVSIFMTSNIENAKNMVNKLSEQLKFEEYKENSILCKEGDKGEKLYIILKGESGVLTQREGTVECSQYEYIKYLLVLYLYQELNIISKTIYYNKQIMKVEENCIYTLFMVFRFYKYYKDHNFYLSNSKKIYDHDNIYEFVINEKKLKEYIYKKFDYPVEDSVYIFDFGQKIIRELFEFYERKIEEIYQKTEEDEDSYENSHKKPSIFFKPSNIRELYTYSRYHKAKVKANKKFKNYEEIFNKIFSINEISKQIINNDDIKNYIKRIDFNNIMKYIKEDFNSYHNIFLKLKEVKETIKYYYYNEINTISEGSIFGDLALNNLNKKRTATIITKEKSYFAVLSKKVYDNYIKLAQIKSRIRKVLFYTEGPIFKGLSPRVFLNNFFFRIKKLECTKGKIIFNQGNKRNKIYFIVKGEFELSGKMTLKEIEDLIKELGGICDNKKEKYLCDLYTEFMHFYTHNKINIKFCVLKRNQIMGLDDMCLKNKYLFNCKCISADENELYEYDYINYDEALKDYELIFKNNVIFVNKRRELLINILFEQRNSLVELEYNKIKMDYEKKKKLLEVDLTKKHNIIGSLMKKVKYNNKQKIITIFEKYKNNKYIKNSQLYNTNKSNNTCNNSLNNSNNSNNSNNNNKINFKSYSSSKTDIKILHNNYSSEKNINIKIINKDNNKIFIKNNRTSFPKIMSEKKFKINYGDIFNKNNKENEKLIEKKINEIKLDNIKHKIKYRKNIKLKIYDSNNNNNYFNSNTDNRESTKYNSISPKNSNAFYKSLNSSKNHPKTIEIKKRRNIIPFFINTKLPLKNNHIKKLKNDEKFNFKKPFLYKEYFKEYKITKTKISNTDDFYLNNQENIFNIFNRYNIQDLKIESIKKKKNTNKKSIQRNIKTKTNYMNYMDNKLKDKNRVEIFYSTNNIPKEAGIIDCLCLDNWAEKTQFEKNYFSQIKY